MGRHFIVTGRTVLFFSFLISKDIFIFNLYIRFASFINLTASQLPKVLQIQMHSLTQLAHLQHCRYRYKYCRLFQLALLG